MAALFDSLHPGPVLRIVVQYLIAFCSQTEAASDVIPSSFVRLVVRDKCAKFGDPRLTRSREIRPEVVGGGIFDIFLTITSDRKHLVTLLFLVRL